MDHQGDGPGGMQADSERLGADWADASLPEPGARAGGPTGAVKWWRWYAPAGRWMPSEPPPAGADTAFWFSSDTPPLFAGPRTVSRGTGTDRAGAGPTLSSSSSTSRPDA